MDAEGLDGGVEGVGGGRVLFDVSDGHSSLPARSASWPMGVGREGEKKVTARAQWCWRGNKGATDITPPYSCTYKAFAVARCRALHP